MKFYLFFLFLFTQAFILGQNVTKEDSIKEQKDLFEERVRIFKESIKIYNERCKKDSIRAFIDSKTQNKYFLYNVAPIGADFPAKKEFKAILEKYNISWGGMGINSDRPHVYTENKCYNSFMNFFTRQKFGEKFMNNLVKQALLEYIDKNQSEVFKYNEHFDMLYDNNDFPHDKLINEYFFKDFTYPKGYEISKRENEDFTEVELDFNDETHKLTIEGFTHHIDNHYNKQFIPYFEKKIRHFIKSRNFVTIEHTRYEVKTRFKIYYK